MSELDRSAGGEDPGCDERVGGPGGRAGGELGQPGGVPQLDPVAEHCGRRGDERRASADRRAQPRQHGAATTCGRELADPGQLGACGSTPSSCRARASIRNSSGFPPVASWQARHTRRRRLRGERARTTAPPPASESGAGRSAAVSGSERNASRRASRPSGLVARRGRDEQDGQRLEPAGR